MTTSSIEEEVNYTSLIELFGTFFEKVTNSHPLKDPLNKHLADFKRMLYTNKSNLQVVETYLDDLKKKTQGSAKTVKGLATDQQLTSENQKISQKSDTVRSNKRYKTFGPETSRTGTKTHKFETLNVSSFIKNRSLEHSNQKQSLLAKYSHIYEFELDSSNFYRLIAVGTIMHLINASESSAKLSEIIEDVASHKIVLKNYYYSYSHEEYANVFCGYIEQILLAKKEGKPVQSILQLFQDMVKYDHLFNIALLCYLKGKLINFVTEQLPKGPWNNQTVWEQLHSSDITEKILNNNPMIFESLLHILPFLLNLRIVTQITENGTLYEKSYSKRTLGVVEENPSSPENFGQAIHLLVEKIFTTSNFYLLVPSNLSTVMNTLPPPQMSNRAIIDDIKQKYSMKITLKSASHENKTAATVDTYQSSNSSTSRRQIDTEVGVLSDRVNQSPGGKNVLNGVKSPRFFMTPSKLQGADSGTELVKDAPRSEKKKTATEYSEIVNGSLHYQLERSNGKENKITFEKKSPQERKDKDNKDRYSTSNLPESRTSSLPSARISPQSTNSQGYPERRDEASYASKQIETDERARQQQIALNQLESPYDLYIKTKSQHTIATARPLPDDKVSGLSSRPGSVTYAGNPFNYSTPYDNYVSSYNFPSQTNPLSTNRIPPSHTHTLSTEPSDLIQKTTMASHSQASIMKTSSDSPSAETMNKYTKFPGEHPNLGFDSYHFSSVSDTDQALRERLKTIGTLAPKANDATPSNPFTQVSAKNITTIGSMSQNTQYSYNQQHSRHNFHAKTLPSYAIPIPLAQDSMTTTNAAHMSSKVLVNESFHSNLPSGVSYSSNMAQNLTVTNQSSRYGTNQVPVSVDSSFTKNNFY